MHAGDLLAGQELRTHGEMVDRIHRGIKVLSPFRQRNEAKEYERLAQGPELPAGR